MTAQRVAVVTGANKGIGLAIVSQLAQQYPSSALNNGSPLLIYLTARSKERGEAALQDLQADKSIQSSGAKITYHPLDIGSTSSIATFAEHVKKQHPEGIDVLINNAGIAMDGFDSNVVKQTLACNYHGTLAACNAFLPLFKPASTSRLVNVASMAGKLNKYSDNIRDRFLHAKSVSEITALMDDFTSSVEKGTQEKDGWPSAAYAVSKSGVIGMTKTLAEQETAKGNPVLINSCCPGYVLTDMTKGRGRKTPEQGAQTPVMLALADLKESGKFWQHEEVSEW